MKIFDLFIKEITRVWEDTINIKVKENDLVELPCAIAPRSAKDDILWTFNNRTIGRIIIVPLLSSVQYIVYVHSYHNN